MAIIALARQFGSGGADIAHRVAASLGYACLDKELLVEVARQAHMDEETVTHADERGRHPVVHFLAKYLVGERHIIPGWGMDYAWSDALDERRDGEAEPAGQADRKFFEAVIKKLGEEGNAVIVGRGAGIVLGGHAELLTVCVTASFEYRVQRVRQRQNLAEEEARALVERTDAQRARYLKQNYAVDWYDARQYHLVVDAEKTSDAGAARLIVQAVAESGLGAPNHKDGPTR